MASIGAAARPPRADDAPTSTMPHGALGTAMMTVDDKVQSTVDAAAPTTSASPTPPDSPISECFLCCEPARPGAPLISGVCLCRRTAMHLQCQKRMLETASRGHDDRARPRLTRCSVCHASYVNADLVAYWRVSWLGALWCTCGIGVCDGIESIVS